MARPRKNPLTVKKICEHCNTEFEISYRKKNQRFCNKICANACKSTKDKIRQSQEKTFKRIYGGHPMTTENTREKFYASMESKYGEKHALKNKDIHDAMTKKNLEKYGVEYYNNPDKMKRTLQERYGVDNIRKCESFKPKLAKLRKHNHYEFLLNLFKENKLTLKTTKGDYNGVYPWDKHEFECNVCGNKFLKPLYSPHEIECERCNPNSKYKQENSLHQFLIDEFKDLIIERRNRILLGGQEIDFLIHKKLLGIEYNGLYWHSEFSGRKNKIYHLNKTAKCLIKGYNLIHIYDYEWINKTEIVKSILRTKFRVGITGYYARSCNIQYVDSKESNNFLEENHIQGKDNAPIRLGLYLDEKLVSLMTFRASRFDHKYQYEISRFCNKLNCSVIGGASKLFKKFVSDNSPKSIISYSDRRYFDGKIYQTLNFEFINNTPPNYYYISPNYKSLYSRQKFQKHKLNEQLENFKQDLTEWENMKDHGYDRIWDCGNSKWVWKSV